MSRATKDDIRPPGPDRSLEFHHFIQYFAVLSFKAVACLAPGFLARWFGATLGHMLHLLARKHRRIGMHNLDLVFGAEKSEAEKKKILRNCFLHYGRALMETLRLARINEHNFLENITLQGVDGFYQALDQGKGVILCSAHYGNWEVMNLVLGYLKLPLSAMARPIDNPLVHKVLEKLRTRPGNRVIYKHKSVRKLLANLRENRIIGIVNDQDVHDRNRIMVDFFGHPAATTPIPAALAIKTGAPIITGYAVPRGKGHYLLTFGNLIHPQPDADKDAEILRITKLLNLRLEAQIRAEPAYWMWLHQRFKTGKNGVTDFYKRPRHQK